MAIRALAVTAHYDDALLWAGGTIRRTHEMGWDWTVVATCVDDDSRRAYFEAWCASLDIRSVHLPFIDHPDGAPFSQNRSDDMFSAVHAAAADMSFDWLFTHSLSSSAEYGPHPNHAEAARTAVRLIERSFAKTGLVSFAYRATFRADGVAACASPSASHYVQLAYDQLQWKAAWCARAHEIECRDPTLDGRSWLERLAWPCPNPEAFLGTNIGLPALFRPSTHGTFAS